MVESFYGAKLQIIYKTSKRILLKRNKFNFFNTNSDKLYR